MNPIPVTLPPHLRPRPGRMQSRPLHPELAIEHDRFVEMLLELMKTHAGKWNAMKDGKVIAVADDENAVATAAYRLLGGVTFLVRKVTDQPLPIERLPRLREIGPAKRPTPEEIRAILEAKPKVFPGRPVHPKLAAEHDCFVERLPELMKTYKDKWIALHDGEIVAVGEDEVDVLTEAGEKQPGVLHFARQVTDQPLPIERLPIGRPREIGPVRPLPADVPVIVDNTSP